MPFFSVIVPEHNSEKFMRKGLDSIKEQLNSLNENNTEEE